MKGTMQSSTANSKEALRSRITQLFRDFDFRTGPFKDVVYCSPREIVEEAWIEYAGRSVSELRDAITAWRTNVACKNGIDPSISRVVEDLKSGVGRWQRATGYRRKPARVRMLVAYQNRDELTRFISGTLVEIGLDAPRVSRYPDQLSFGGRFADTFGHRIVIGGQVKFLYGGALRAWLQFPYYDHSEGDPSMLSIEGLIGLHVCTFLGIDPPECMIWTADRGKDAFPNIDGYLKILGTVCDYLRAPELPAQSPSPASGKPI
jgi:hypothetical protein